MKAPTGVAASAIEPASGTTKEKAALTAAPGVSRRQAQRRNCGEIWALTAAFIDQGRCPLAPLDLCGLATLTITAQGGEIAFGALVAGLDVAYAPDSIDFRWYGADEGDQVEGEGNAELLDDGTIEIEFSSDNGDEAVLKARREDFLPAC